MDTVQFYKQRQWTIDVDGSSMAPGWYWVKQRPCLYPHLPPVPFGKSTGPFRLKREAERDYRQTQRLS